MPEKTWKSDPIITGEGRESVWHEEHVDAGKDFRDEKRLIYETRRSVEKNRTSFQGAAMGINAERNMTES